MKEIIIKKEYFDNIEEAVKSIKDFFESNYSKRNLPVVDNATDLDPSVAKVIDIINTVEPTWLNNPDSVDATIQDIKSFTDDYDSNEEDVYDKIYNDNNTPIIDKIDSFISFKECQNIKDHLEEFCELLNGIQSFELFTKPSMFRKVIELFSSNISLSELGNLMEDHPTTVFDPEMYVKSLFHTSLITFPSDMKVEDEIIRFISLKDLDPSIEVRTDDTVQEAAEVNFFENVSPQHIKFDEKNKKFVISNEYKSVVNKLISQMEKCNSTEDLKKLFESTPGTTVDMLTENNMPFILAKVFNNTKKYPNNNFKEEDLGNYIKSYKSISDRNSGAKRFINYDLFSTFKIDKEGTINFLKDFLTLAIFNDPKVAISNNTILTIFNIFDSRIYFDILYNVLPDSMKQGEYATEDQFVKSVRGKLNKNSRNINVYKQDNAQETPNNKIQNTEDVMKESYHLFDEFGDMSTTDMSYCEQFKQILMNEINTLDHTIISEMYSPILIGQYADIYSDKTDVIQEAYKGEIPEYMKTRVELSDEMEPVKLTTIQVPPTNEVPENPIPDLASSIEEKIDEANSYDDMLGNENPAKGSNVVYNITNNYSYNNSFNKETINKNQSTRNNTTDNSTGKTINTNNSKTSNDSSTGKTVKNSMKSVANNSYNRTNNRNIPDAINNNNNSNMLKDTKDSEEFINPAEYENNHQEEEVQEFSTGYSIKDVFAFLESEEPLSDTMMAMEKPKSDLLTTAMDTDRNTLAFQEKVKRGVEKGISTAKAAVKPISRTKQWLAGIVDSLVERDEDKVKTEIIENPSYRTVLFKAGRLACKLGLTGILFTINGFLGGAYALTQVARFADRQRLKKEIQGEYMTQIEIMNTQIRDLDMRSDPESQEKKYRLMRMRDKMKRIVVDTPRSLIKNTKTVG